MSKTRSFEPSFNGRHWMHQGVGPAVKKAYHKSVRQMVRGHGGQDRMVANRLTEIKYKSS